MYFGYHKIFWWVETSSRYWTSLRPSEFHVIPKVNCSRRNLYQGFGKLHDKLLLTNIVVSSDVGQFLCRYRWHCLTGWVHINGIAASSLSLSSWLISVSLSVFLSPWSWLISLSLSLSLSICISLSLVLIKLSHSVLLSLLELIYSLCLSLFLPLSLELINLSLSLSVFLSPWSCCIALSLLS